MATKKFKCKVCGYIHEGAEAPAACPVCKAPKSEFEEVLPEKKGINTSGNLYTVLYAAVMVVIVAFLLVFVSSSLKERQEQNVIQDTQKQILSSIGIRESQDVKADYAKFIKADMLVQADGSLVENTKNFSTSYKGEFSEGRLHVFVAEVDGATKYIIPLNGLGLWGAIWGYVALDSDKETVYGVYFSHASETPGLGAEIATLKFQERFKGKRLVENGGVCLDIVKAGTVKNAKFEVDGVSGATITSKGVNTMIESVMSSYLPFLNKSVKLNTEE